MSEAWHAAASHLFTIQDRRASHLIVAIDDPRSETNGVRALLDELLGDTGAGTSAIERVADTIFPNDLYVPGEPAADERLFERHAAAREFAKLSVPHGNYFDHLVAYPQGQASFNQLRHAVTRLRQARNAGRHNASWCELGIPAELRLHRPGEHVSIMGFPCLSHVSVTLADDKIEMIAVYRKQDFTAKGYGNFLGLGRLAAFLATESGYEVGGLLCIAAGAIMTKPPAGTAKLRSVVNGVGKMVNGAGIGS